MYWNERNDANIDQFTLRSWQGYAAQISAKAHCLLDDGYDGEDAGIVREQAEVVVGGFWSLLSRAGRR